MKRAALGGAHRGPVAPRRQRRTIRFVQLLLVLLAVGLFVFSGYSFGREAGYRDGRRAEEIDAPSEPSLIQAAVLIVLGGVALAGASLLGLGRELRIPTPAKLDDLAGRAESAAVRRAEEAAAGRDSEPASPSPG